MDVLPEGFVKSIYVAPRAHGKTTMMVDWVRRNPDSIMISVNFQQKKIIEKQYPELRGRVFSPEQATRGSMRGFGKVLVGVDDLDYDALTEDFINTVQVISQNGGIDFATVTDDGAEDYLKIRKRNG